MVLKNLMELISLPQGVMHPKIMPLSSSSATIMNIGFTSDTTTLKILEHLLIKILHLQYCL